jgi:hypothetical protein
MRRRIVLRIYYFVWLFLCGWFFAFLAGPVANWQGRADPASTTGELAFALLCAVVGTYVMERH